MNKIIEYIIRAKDATGAGIRSALGKLKNFAKAVGTNLQNIRAGFEMLKGAASTFLGAMGKAFEFEKMTRQFKFLIGNMDEAREHMRMLQAMGDTPPFSLEEFAAASRSLMVLTDGALGFQKSLELVGDAAAATGVDIKSMADYVGRAYAIIRDGQPITRATMTLRNMGAITPEVASKLDEMQKAGKSNYEIWQTLTSALGKFNGAMAETEQTGAGTMAAIGSLWDDTIRDFGGAVLETTKDALGGLLGWMKQLREDGTIEVWADKCGRALETVVAGFKELKDVGETVIDAIWNKSGLSDVWHQVKGELNGAASFVGALAGGASLKDAGRMAAQDRADEKMKGYYTNKIVGAFADKLGTDNPWKKAYDAQKDEAEKVANHEAAVRAQGVAKHAKAEADAAKKKADEEQKIREEMARKQEEADRKAAEKAAEFKRKNAEDVEAARLAAVQAREDAEMEIARKVAAEEIRTAEEVGRKKLRVIDKTLKAELDALETERKEAAGDLAREAKIDKKVQEAKDRAERKREDVAYDGLGAEAFADKKTKTAEELKKAGKAVEDELDRIARKQADLAEQYYERLKDATDEEQVAKIKAENEVANKRLENERKVAEARKEQTKAVFEHERELADRNLRESISSQENAQSRLDRARQKVQEAWGWYRDPTSMQAKIEDYKEQKEAKKRWEKDFAKLKSRHRDWRDIEFGKLSAEDEATRQVALAKEEEQAAQEALDKIVANTEHLKTIAEALEAKEDA